MLNRFVEYVDGEDVESVVEAVDCCRLLYALESSTY